MPIRLANQTDTKRLSDIYVASRQAHFHWHTEPFSHEDFEKDTAEDIVYVLEENGVIIGFSALYVQDSFIHCLFIDPDYQHKGAGSILLCHATTLLPHPVTLKCVSENKHALAFYARHHFEKVHEEGPSNERYWLLALDEKKGPL